MWRTALFVGVAACLCAGAAVAAIVLSENGTGGPGTRAPTPVTDVPAAARVRGCRDRIEAGRLHADPAEDAIIGPLAFSGLAANYRQLLDSWKRSRGLPAAPPGFDAPPIKSVALLSAGVRVTLVVPREQRRWMQLLYDPRDVWRRDHAIALQACRRLRSRAARRSECGWRPDLACRSINTQFSGAVYIDFDDAPEHGRCAELIVAPREERPLRKPLFPPTPRGCLSNAD